MLAFVVTAIPSLTASECALSFISANPDLRKFELYDTWFDDNSTTTLAQAGVYKGADDIKEYIKFVWASPYISANGFLHDQYSLVSFDEEKRSCVFMSLVHSRFQMSEMGGNELFETVSFNTAEWRFDDRKVGRLEFFYAPDFINRFFSSIKTPGADSFVCQVMRDTCPDVWAANDLTSLGECEAKLAALPLADGDLAYVDGNTQSCRKLHAVFASDNAHHCAHLSFKPMADPKGKVKCQESAQLPVSDLFSDDELATFAAFAVELGFEPDQHVRSSPCETQADCPVAGDAEETPATVTGNYYTGNYYTNDAKCVFGAPTERRLLFGPTPQVGMCVPT